tara:strand:- start:195 stop:1238 length:1044 start_codon:yes stop_codon:yes gene_type:complete
MKFNKKGMHKRNNRLQQFDTMQKCIRPRSLKCQKTLGFWQFSTEFGFGIKFANGAMEDFFITRVYFSKKQTMHASQLAELGSWIALHSGNFIYGENHQPSLAATHYWTASKIRHQRWVAALKMFEQDFANCELGHDPWPAFEIVVQEILLSELLTRVWSATVITHDWYHQQDEMHGVAHSVHVAHIEAKNRAIRILLHARPENEVVFDRLNRLRRRVERWTDMFLGQLPNGEKASIFGFDRNRVLDFNREQDDALESEIVMRQRVISASFSVDVIRDQTPYSANPDLNRKLAAGILDFFTADRFDSNSMPKSTRMIWMEKAQVDTQLLLDELVDFENDAECSRFSLK